MPGVPAREWEDFLTYWRRSWHQGEHVSYIGPTGSGKTTLALGLLPARQYVVALATKPRDATMDKLVRSAGWKQIASWDDRPPLIGTTQRLVLWPPFRKPEDINNQQYQIDRAMRTIFTAGGWTVFADELFYLGRQLKLNPLLELYWTQGRSLGLSLVGGTQRPAHVPLLAYDQPTHLFFWRDNDETNLRRIGGLGGLHSGRIRATVAALPRHVALYVNARTGEMFTTLAPKP